MPETRLERTRRELPAGYQFGDAAHTIGEWVRIPMPGLPLFRVPVVKNDASNMIDGVLHALKRVEDRRERRRTGKSVLLSGITNG